MDWQEISVATEEQAVEAVADLFYQLGSGGVVIEDPKLVEQMAASGQWDACELPEGVLKLRQPIVKGYLALNEELPGKLEELYSELDEIAMRIGGEPGKVSLRLVNQEDWANSWKAYFKPLKIGERLVIRPTWEPYQAGAGELVLDLDPGMAFGTGSHATTAMCVRLLEKHLQPGHYVMDVGTGTGILAMTAALLGAEKVLALDVDTVAVRVAADNIRQNDLAKVVATRVNNLLVGIEEKADLIVANIVADIIIRLLPQAVACLKPGGRFIASGIIGERRDDVSKVAGQLGLSLVEEENQEGWVAQVWQVKEC